MATFDDKTNALAQTALRSASLCVLHDLPPDARVTHYIHKNGLFELPSDLRLRGNPLSYVAGALPVQQMEVFHARLKEATSYGEYVGILREAAHAKHEHEEVALTH